MQRKKLPLGKTTFKDIRDPKENYAYIDKTEMAYQMVSNSTYNFLSRPRRFGKSLFLDTLSEIFKGSKSLFEGLHIYDKWDWEQTYPVIKVSFGSGSYTSEELIEGIFAEIFRDNNKALNLSVAYSGLGSTRSSLKSLIMGSYEKYGKKVVLLIDEYDKLILDNIDNEDKALAVGARKALRNFYSAIKDCDSYLRFVFITGVSKFSKLNLFSGLNNLTDITLNQKYATITGYTHADVLEQFSDRLQGVDMEEVRHWYNGYNYFGEPIYNPYDILQFLENNCEFSNYWWQTGNPAFLIDILKQRPHFLPDLQTKLVSEETLNAFDVEHIDLVALLWQTGYLTFDKRINMLGGVKYKMKVPNLEVQSSLNSLFIDYLTNFRSDKTQKQFETAQALTSKDLGHLQRSLIALFAAIPYENYVNNNISSYEGYYASVVFAFMASIGAEVVVEDSTNHGRVDMSLFTPDAIFIIEFKVDLPTEAALKQIKERKYYEKYTAQGKEIFLVGIHFDSNQRNIAGFEWELKA